MNGNRLLGKIKENQMTIGSVAEAIGISLSAFRRKIYGESDFTRDEIMQLADLLHLTDAEVLEIFFDRVVS